MEEITRALQGYRIVDVYRFEDWPAHGSSEEDWIDDVERLVETYGNLRHEICEMDDERLDEVVECTSHGDSFEFTLRKMLYGAIDHNIYHAGQISLLRSS